MTETTATPTPEERRTRREAARSWSGYLAEENIAHVHERIVKMLTGRLYTWVANNVEQKHTAPEVRTSQKLKDDKREPSAILRTDNDLFSTNYSDSYGVWGLWTTHKTEREAWEDRKIEKTNWTYVNIEGDGTGQRDKIEVHHYNGFAEMLHWVIMPEHPQVLIEDAETAEEAMTAFFCPDCQHPWGYHTYKGCCMPVIKGTKAPKGRNDSYADTENCACQTRKDS